VVHPFPSAKTFHSFTHNTEYDDNVLSEVLNVVSLRFVVAIDTAN